MPATRMKTSPKRFSASELRRMPVVERDAILAVAAEKAAKEYRANKSLTAFDAFGEDDLYGSSCDSETSPR